MRNYRRLLCLITAIEKQALGGQNCGVNEMKNKITNAEMRERADIVAQTNANNLLEGITPIEEGTFEKELETKWIKGEITATEAREILNKIYGLEK